MRPEVFTLRADEETREGLRRLQGRLQAQTGRRVTMQEALKFALASVPASAPVGVEAPPGTNFLLGETQQEPKRSDDAA